MDAQQQKHLSKAMSLVLRHKPWLYELELDDEGWTSVEALLDGLRSHGPEWHNLTAADLAEISATSPKRRFEMQGERIRALYGHSIPGKLLKTPAAPPETLYHGTVESALGAIRGQGLRPMSRQYVHFSVDRGMASQVAGRKRGDVVILTIRAGDAHRADVAFYAGNEYVWLADRVPPEFIDFPL
jgi:putative RNA 2'-phosphotransferase